MNKIVASILIIFSISSCNKDRTCTCKVSEPNKSTYEVTYTLKKIKKSKAKSNCFDYDVTESTSGQTIKYDCILK